MSCLGDVARMRSAFASSASDEAMRLLHGPAAAALHSASALHSAAALHSPSAQLIEYDCATPSSSLPRSFDSWLGTERQSDGVLANVVN